MRTMLPGILLYVLHGNDQLLLNKTHLGHEPLNVDLDNALVGT